MVCSNESKHTIFFKCYDSLLQVPFCEDESVLNYSELHFSKVTSFKIGTLVFGQKSPKTAIVIHADERARSASSQLFWCGALQKLASLYSRCTYMKELYCSARTPCMLYNNIRSDRLRPLRGTQDLKRSLL